MSGCRCARAFVVLSFAVGIENLPSNKLFSSFRYSTVSAPHKGSDLPTKKMALSWLPGSKESSWYNPIIEDDSLEESKSFLESTFQNDTRPASHRLRRALHVLYTISTILVISSLVLTFIFNFTIVKKDNSVTVRPKPPYGNPIENGRIPPSPHLEISTKQALIVSSAMGT